MGIWLILTIWMLLAAVFVLAICAAAARPIPQPVASNVEKRRPFNRETIRNQIIPLGIISLACLLLAGLLWSGCAASRSYPGSMHGLTFNSTIESIDIQNHRLSLAALKPGEPMVFAWESTTKFWKHGVPIQPESLEPTWPVRVHYHATSGQMITHHVYIQAAYPVVH